MSWRHKWKRNGWKMSKKLNASEPKNLDLWKVLDRLAESVEIELVWIRGHNGQVENERVDKLSMKAALANVSPAVISEWNRQMWKRKADRGPLLLRATLRARQQRPSCS